MESEAKKAQRTRIVICFPKLFRHIATVIPMIARKNKSEKHQIFTFSENRQDKMDAIANTLKAKETTNLVPSTMLKTHPDFTLYIDEDSAKGVLNF